MRILTEFPLTDDVWALIAKTAGAVCGSAISLAYVLPRGRREAALRFATGLVAGMVSFALADMRGTAMSSLKEAGVWCDAKQSCDARDALRRAACAHTGGPVQIALAQARWQLACR